MKIAILQIEVIDRAKEENIAHAEMMIDKARGADLILLPELWNIGFYAFEKYLSESETAEGPTISMIGRKARGLNAHILSGSIVEKDGGKYFNTNFLIDPKGNILGKYRKIHLFSFNSDEKKLLSPGVEPATIKTDKCAYGLSTCYDLRFPELYRAELAEGAQAFLISAAWGYERREHWTIFHRARALENQAFVISSACTGTHRGHRLAGHSMIVSPYGDILAKENDDEGILTADIDLDMVQKVRHDFPAISDKIL